MLYPQNGDSIVAIDSVTSFHPVYSGLGDMSRRRASVNCTACLVVRRPRRAADTSTNRRQGFLCRRTASMEHAADTAEAGAVDRYFPSSTVNI